MRGLRAIFSCLWKVRKEPRLLRQVVLALPRILLWTERFRKSVFLIHREGGAGDIVCTFPSLATLKYRRPNGIIIYETQARYMPLVESCDYVDLTVEASSALAELIRNYLTPHLLHPLLPDEKNPPRPRERIHLVRAFLQELGFRSVIEEFTSLQVTDRALAQAWDRLKQDEIDQKPFIVIHTGPSWKVKEWPQEKWDNLVVKIKSQLGYEVIQVGEDPTKDGQNTPTPRIAETRDWVGTLTIDQLLALLSIAKLFVDIDSGLLHLSAAVGTPCIGIFGPTSPEFFLPKTIPSYSITSNVPCLGCDHNSEGPLHWKDGCPYNIRCMTELSADAVFSMCQKILSTGSLDAST